MELGTLFHATDLPLTAKYVPPDLDGGGKYDGEIEFRDTAGALCPLVLQVSVDGDSGALHEYDRRDGQVVGVTLLKTYAEVSAWDVWSAVGAWLDKQPAVGRPKPAT
jgi:hypothetical protein